MLKKIPVQQLRMGMHLHTLECSWIQHPFWKSRFVIDSASDLQRLQTCGVTECLIDTALGLDVAAPQLAAAVAPLAAVAPVMFAQLLPSGDERHWYVTPEPTGAFCMPSCAMMEVEHT